MRLSSHWSVLALLLALVGCGKDDPKSGSPDPAPVAGSGAEPAAIVVPDELKHAAYEYYGLEKPGTVEMDLTLNGTKSAGGREMKLVGVKDGAAEYEVQFTGALAAQGTINYRLEKGGLYATGMSNGKMTPSRYLELPANLAPGETWTQKITLALATAKITTEYRFKVVGEQSVKTKMGEQTALYVSGSGKSTQHPSQAGAKPVTTNDQMRVWYVKGMGPVKMELIQAMKGNTNSILIEITKVVEE